MRGGGGRPGLVAAAGLAVAIGAAGAWWAWSRSRTDRGPTAAGLAAYDRGDFAASLAAAVGRLRTVPDDPEALRLLARSNARLGRDGSAQQAFVRIGPNAWKAEDFFLLAVSLLRQGRAELARETLLNALKADPAHAETIEALARLALEGQRPIEAAALARRLAARPGWESRGDILLARALEASNDHAGAADSLGRALGRDPASLGPGAEPGPLRKELARDLLGAGRPDEARRQLLALAGTLDDDAEASWLRGRAGLQLGSTAEASRPREESGGRDGADPLRVEPAPLVGASRCEECHATIYRAQRASRHATTLAAGPDLLAAAPTARAVDDPARPGARHALRRDGDRLLYEAEARGTIERAVVEYAFGSGDRGRTFVGTDEAGRARELRLSQYEGGSLWDVTTGQSRDPSDPHDLLGRPVGADELRRCLDCHTTRTALDRGRPAPEGADRGIGCERCHGPGGHHLAAVAGGLPDPAIARPRLATAARVVALCGHCHGPPDPSTPPTGPGAVRFQASSLVESRCYTEGRGDLSCATCHDPHRDAGRLAAPYEAKCRGCHPATPAVGPVPADPGPAPARPCPVDPARGCVKCHMPRVEGVVPHSAFTDHRIRIHRASDAAP